MKPHGTLSKSHVFNERLIDVPLLLYGVLFICAGMLMYLFGVLMSLPRLIFGLNRLLLGLNEWIVWYSGVPIMVGTLLVFADLFVLFPAKGLIGPNRVRKPAMTGLPGHNASPLADQGTNGEAVGSPLARPASPGRPWGSAPPEITGASRR
jgi:hypothetical protein